MERGQTRRFLFLFCAAFAAVLTAIAFLPERRVEVAGSATPGLRADLDPNRRLSFHMERWELVKALDAYSELTGCAIDLRTRSIPARLDRFLGGLLTRWRWVRLPAPPDSGIRFHGDGRLTASELKRELDAAFATNGLRAVVRGPGAWRLVTTGS